MNDNPQIPNQKFSKSEKLCSIADIDRLFSKGKNHYSSPLKIVWAETKHSDTSHAKILISVPKRLFKKATDRNLLKRRIREAYRKNKFLLLPTLEDKNIQLSLAFVYIDSALADYFEIEAKIVLLLQTVSEKYAKMD